MIQPTSTPKTIHQFFIVSSVIKKKIKPTIIKNDPQANKHVFIG